MEAFVGQIILMGGNITPLGFAACNGALLTVRDHMALFFVIGNKHGGDGKTDFAVPKLTAPEGTFYFIATEGNYPQQ